jgi:hypothetical protein
MIIGNLEAEIVTLRKERDGSVSFINDDSAKIIGK